jgi:peptidyl-tRNA hydrolase, PTH1 family
MVVPRPASLSHAMHETPLKLVVGLGNPGADYASTRHNIGFAVVEQLAGQWRVTTWKAHADTQVAVIRIDKGPVVIAKPQGFMNRSGSSVVRLIQEYRIHHRDMLVIHDDIDLMFGRLKIQEKGGCGGHKGVRSIIDAVGTREFTRLRIGIGRPAKGISVEAFVLEPFDASQQSELNQIMDRAREAVATILCKGTREGMNRFNRKI